MDRDELLAVLKKVSPALSGRDLIPVFSCFCFTADHVYAYDDVVALRFPFKSGLSGAVRGQLLLSFLTASRTKAVEVSQDGDAVRVKAGRAKLDTTALPETDFLFNPPSTKKATERVLDAKFLAGLGRAAVSIGRDPSHPWRQGVTVAFGEDGVRFYATDNKTAVRVTVGKPVKVGEGSATILPPRFVELLQDVGKADPPKALFLTAEWVEARFTSGLRLFSRTISGADVKAIAAHFTKHPEVTIPIPSGLDRCLARAMVVAPYSKEPYTKVTVGSGRVKLYTASPAGNVTDALTLDPPDAHPDQECSVLPDLVRRALTPATSLAVMEDRIVLQGRGYIYLVSAAAHVVDASEEAAE